MLLLVCFHINSLTILTLKTEDREFASPLKVRANTVPVEPIIDNSDLERIERIKEHCQCTICLELPKILCAVYQCSMGHIYCQGCLSRLVADGVIQGDIIFWYTVYLYTV